MAARMERVRTAAQMLVVYAARESALVAERADALATSRRTKPVAVKAMATMATIGNFGHVRYLSSKCGASCWHSFLNPGSLSHSSFRVRHCGMLLLRRMAATVVRSSPVASIMR